MKINKIIENVIPAKYFFIFAGIQTKRKQKDCHSRESGNPTLYQSYLLHINNLHKKTSRLDPRFRGDDKLIKLPLRWFPTNISWKMAGMTAKVFIPALLLAACTQNPPAPPVANQTVFMPLEALPIAQGAEQKFDGNYMDEQAIMLRQTLQGSGVIVSQDGRYVVLNMPSNITFEFNKSELRHAFQPVIMDLARLFQQYDQTRIEIFGHTCSIGSDQANMNLSNERARSVANFLSGQGINPARLSIHPRGEAEPIASNETEEGRHKNRRVEIKLSPL